MNDDILQEQIRYYRARAAEYDQWACRRGRYDYGPEHNRRWHDQVAEVRAALHRSAPVESALELACGTGIWTGQLLKFCARVTALDASPEMLAINRAKLASARVQYQQVDLFRWQPQTQYGLVFCGFWLSHVPPAALDAFLQQVARAVQPGGRLFLVDSRRDPRAGTRDKPLYSSDADSIHDERVLNDGRQFTIIKVFHEPQELGAHLTAAGLRPGLRVTENFFLYGTAEKPA